MRMRGVTTGAVKTIVLIGAVLSGLVSAGMGAAGPAPEGVAQEQPPPTREFTVVARRYAFEPARIEVNQGDLVKVTIVAEDIPHSFTVDAYRICKRVVPGRPVTVEFLASTRGTFAFYCNLTQEEGCRHMRGELVVR